MGPLATLLLLASTVVPSAANAPGPARAQATTIAPRHDGLPGFTALERSFHPPVDAEGRAWLVEVVAERPDGTGAPVATAAARRDGTWRHAKVPAGEPVRLRVRTEDGDTWWMSPEPFDPGGTPPEEAIDLGLVPVRGVARIGKQPLAGLATFTDGSGVKVSLVVDAEGRFDGALPRDGMWTARVRSVRAAFENEMEVEVPRPESAREGKALSAFVDVHFPDLAIRGEVLDEEGKPVEGFTLWICLAGTASLVPSTYEGSTFRYDRIAMGTAYDFFVTVPERSSGLHRIEVPPDDDPEYVRVVVRRWKPFRGHVVSAGGTPARDGYGFLATVPGNGLDRQWIVPRGLRAPVEGRVPERARHACVVFFPRGQALHVSRRNTEVDDHEILVRPDGGRLDLKTPVDPLRGAALFREGCAVRLGTLANSQGATSYRGDEGLEVSLPLVGPGAWSFCLVTPGELEDHVGGEPTFPFCAHGVLEPGGRLELRIPEAAPAP